MIYFLFTFFLNPFFLYRLFNTMRYCNWFIEKCWLICIVINYINHKIDNSITIFCCKKYLFLFFFFLFLEHTQRFLPVMLFYKRHSFYKKKNSFHIWPYVLNFHLHFFSMNNFLSIIKILVWTNERTIVLCLRNHNC